MKWSEHLIDIQEWSHLVGATLGITGSALNPGIAHVNDLDLIAILRDPLLLTAPGRPGLPRGFSERGLREYRKCYELRRIEIFVTHQMAFDQIRLEIYPLHVAERILALEQFIVRRIRQGALVEKKTVFHGTDNSTRTVITSPAKINGASYAEIQSCIWEGGTLFVGVHLERLLLARLINDELRVNSLREATWSRLRKIFADLSPAELPYGGKVERIFHAADKLQLCERDRIRRLLL